MFRKGSEQEIKHRYRMDGHVVPINTSNVPDLSLSYLYCNWVVLQLRYKDVLRYQEIMTEGRDTKPKGSWKTERAQADKRSPLEM